jgi:hypothetical protein
VHEAKKLKARMLKWGDKPAMIGATKWSLCAYLSTIKTLDGNGIHNLAEFIGTLCSAHHAHMAEEIISVVRQSDIGRELIEHLRGSEAYAHLKGLLEKSIT